MPAKFLNFILTVADANYLVALCLSKAGLFVCPVLLGLAATLGYAPYELWPVTFGTLTLFCMLLSRLTSKKAVFSVTLLYLLSLNTVTLWWLDFVLEGFGGMPLLVSFLTVLLLALYEALPAAILNTLAFAFAKGRTAVFICCFLPLAFILADFTVTYLFSGFPWTFFGYTCMTGPFASFAPRMGVRGVSALFVLAAAATALAATRRYLFLPVAALIVIAGVFTAKIEYVEMQAPEKAALVQGNIEQSLKWDPGMFSHTVATYWSLTRPLLNEYSLVIWPESAVPLYIDLAKELLTDLNAAAAESDTALVTGILRRDDTHHYNSILALGTAAANGIAQVYDKRHLVPFGEYTPFESLLRPLGGIFNIPTSNFSTDEANARPLKLGNYGYLPAICYESIFPELMNDERFKESNAIIMVSNDSWFGRTRGPLQHLNIARMRSMEVQKPMLRVTNSGVTAVINPDGSLGGRLPQDEEGVLRAEYTPVKGQTPYARWGNLPLFALMLILLAGGLWGLLFERSKTAKSLEHLVRP